MHLTTIFRHRLLAGLATLTGLMAGAAYAQPPMPPKTEAAAKDSGEIKPGKLGELNVPIGGLGTFDPQRNVTISEIELSNGDVLTADAVAPDLKKVRLTGKLGGATKMTITFSDRTKAAYSVVVQPDYEQLKFVLKRAVPTASIDVIPGVGNVIILSGSVTKPEDADTAIRIASSAVGGSVTNVINALNIGGSQHVLIDVTIAQVDRTELRERGFAFGIFGANVQYVNLLGSLATLPQGGGAAGGSPLLIGSANMVSSIVPGQFVGALRALRTEGLSKFLSEPKLTTMSGRPALLRAGGRQAVLSPAAGINGPGAILEPVGTELEVLPIVRGDGKIYLELNPRITSVNNGRGLTTAFGFTPGFNEQQTRTSVTLEPGQTFAIAGLIETTVQASAEKIPYLGDLPLLGAAFSNMRHEERETELLILVTPRLQEAMNCNQVPSRIPGKETRTVDDYELFLESLIEAPRGQRRPWGGNGPFGYNPAWKCAPNGFPCKNNVCPDGSVGNANLKAPCASGTCATPGVVNHAAVIPQPLNVTPAGGYEPVPIPSNGSER
jgi:pilus assembly protein CpaC